MPTENFKLPLIADNMANDVVRDMNALAEATDGALKGLGDSKANSTDLTKLQTQVTTHLDESKKIVTVRQTSAQSIPNGSYTDLTLGAILDEDSANFCIIEGGKVKFIKPGIYHVIGTVRFTLSTLVGLRGVNLEGVVSQFNVAASTTEEFAYLTTSSVKKANTNSFLTFQAYQKTGSAMSTFTNGTSVIIRKVADL